MKRHDIAKPLVKPMIEPAVGPLVGQLIKPIKTLEAEAHKKDLQKEKDSQKQANLANGTPCYRLEKLLSREVGKRTFLATDIHSEEQVFIKLLLYCPDPQENEIEAALEQRRENRLQPYELSAMLPYLTSFEVETALGMGLALVKPYAQQALVHQSLACQSPVHQSPVHQSPARQSPVYRHDSPGIQHIVATPTSQQVSVAPQTAYSDFRVKAATDRLSIQFLESRISVGVVDDSGDRAEVWLLTVLGTIIFVGGAVAITGSIVLGITIAALLPIFFKQVTAPKQSQTKARKRAIIRLSREFGGRTFLSLTTAVMPRRSRTGHTDSPIESRLHYSRLSVKTVTVAPTFCFADWKLFGWKLFGSKLTFTFYNHDAPSTRLCVVGTYQEIRWIHRHLLQWAKHSGPNSEPDSGQDSSGQ